LPLAEKERPPLDTDLKPLDLFLDWHPSPLQEQGAAI